MIDGCNYRLLWVCTQSRRADTGMCAWKDSLILGWEYLLWSQGLVVYSKVVYKASVGAILSRVQSEST